MSGVKHTPWEEVETESSVDVEGCTGWQDIADQSGRTVAIVIGWGGWTDRDLDRRVSLIAAAPDLLEALEQLLGNAELARFHLTATEEGMLVGSALFDTIQQARAAIARARGEQSQSEKEVGND